MTGIISSRHSIRGLLLPGVSVLPGTGLSGSHPAPRQATLPEPTRSWIFCEPLFEKEIFMKVAITSSGDTLSALVDRRFGRCSFFVFFDTETGETEFLANPNIDHLEGAGVAAVSLVAERGVGKVVSGEFGAKVKTLFDQLQVQLISLPNQNMSIAEVLDMLRKS